MEIAPDVFLKNGNHRNVLEGTSDCSGPSLHSRSEKAKARENQNSSRESSPLNIVLSFCSRAENYFYLNWHPTSPWISPFIVSGASTTFLETSASF